MINYSVHTIQLYCRLSYSEYISAKQNLQHLNCSMQPRKITTKKGITKEYIIYRKLPYYGINSIEIVNIKDDNAKINLKYAIYFTVNLYNAYAHISSPNCHIIPPDAIKSAFRSILKDITLIIKKRHLILLKLKRVDFCFDLTFNNQKCAEEYINLLKLGIPCGHLHEHKHRDNIQHRMVPYKDSLLLKCKSYEFQIYPKYLEMLNRKMENPEEASGIVRVELRAKGKKLSRLAEKYYILSPESSIEEFLINCPIITRKEIPQILTRMVGQHDFYPYDTIRKKIMASKYKDSVKYRMLEISLYLARHSTQNLLEDFGLSRNKWNSLLKKYNDLGCSPIPVPVRYSMPVYPGICSLEQYF